VKKISTSVYIGFDRQGTGEKRPEGRNHFFFFAFGFALGFALGLAFGFALGFVLSSGSHSQHPLISVNHLVLSESGLAEYNACPCKK